MWLDGLGLSCHAVLVILSYVVIYVTWVEYSSDEVEVGDCRKFASQFFRKVKYSTATNF